MKSFIAIIVLLATLAVPYSEQSEAERCSLTNCLITDGCKCSSWDSPIDQSQTPQFVTLAFNEAINERNYHFYYKYLLDFKNADGSKVGATFYIPHEYTDYDLVNRLYNSGAEIAVHSISRNPLTSYWQEANEDTLVEEFNGQRILISKFANIPFEKIVGARTPNLAINGDTTFSAYKKSGILYDNSWPTVHYNRFFPYTLDYKSLQMCPIGVCPTGSFPGMWVLPMIDHVSKTGAVCNALSTCITDAESPEDVKNWLMEQFQRHYTYQRAPITLNIDANFFEVGEHNYKGFKLFLTELEKYEDVYMVSHKEVQDWNANPVPFNRYSRPPPNDSASCSPIMCELQKGDEIRYMRSCTVCPAVYPWVGNPLGEIITEASNNC
nr:uncharacterized protein LOC111426689 [Onthophagus taurus]